MISEIDEVKKVIPHFKDGILLMGLIMVFPIIYIILFIVIQMAESPFLDQLASISSLARCVLLISILWSTLKDGMISNSRAFHFAKLLIVLSEISLISTFSHTVLSIKNSIQKSQVVNRPLIFLLTISTIEFIFNILLILIIQTVHRRAVIKEKKNQHLHQESPSQPLEESQIEIKTPAWDDAKEIVKQRKVFSMLDNAHLDRLFAYRDQNSSSYHQETVQEKIKDQLKIHSHRHYNPKFEEDSWIKKNLERQFYEEQRKKLTMDKTNCSNCGQHL